MNSITKAILFIGTLSLAVVGYVSAQSTHTFKQPAHTFPQKMIWWDSIYLYPEFRTGHITYFTGFAPERDLRVNYNLYYAQFDMIDERGDTVQIAPSKTFRSVSIGNDVFLYDEKEGYMRVMIKGDVSLAERIAFHLAKIEYVSGQIYGTGAGHEVDVRGSTSSYDRYFAQMSIYYFVDNTGKFYLCSRAILKKLFPEYKSAIQDFTKRHNTNFLKESDLREITQYCNKLRRIPTDNTRGILIPANERLSTTLQDSIYRFKGFQDGVVIYEDGRKREFKSALNYNLLTGGMETLQNNDTVRIDNSGYITSANLDGTTFFRKPEGFIEVILNGRVRLGVVRTLSMSHSQAVAASAKYGPDDSYDASAAQNDRVNFDRLFSYKNKYYLIDSYGSVYQPSTATMRRLYPHAQKQLDEYVREHQPDFGNEKDLKDIVSYLSSVPVK